MLTWLNLALLFVILTMVVWAGKLYRRVKELTRQDALTGALSRRGFIGVLGDESKRARRYLHPLTVVYVDLDDFKVVNDVLGHETGNSVLQVVARTMQSTLREVDFVARLGGDEFALLLSETMAGDSIKQTPNSSTPGDEGKGLAGHVQYWCSDVQRSSSHA